MALQKGFCDLVIGRPGHIEHSPNRSEFPFSWCKPIDVIIFDQQPKQVPNKTANTPLGKRGVKGTTASSSVSSPVG